MESTSTHGRGGGKECSVCGEWHEMAHFEYGRRENNSYCQRCAADYSRVYNDAKRAGGDPTEATRAWLASMRASRGAG